MSGEEAAGASGGLRLERLWVLMITAFVDMVGYALILPLLPLYALRFGAEPFLIGLLLAAFAFAQLVTAPLWGRLSDRIGRRPVILFGQVLAAAAFALFAVADLMSPGSDGTPGHAIPDVEALGGALDGALGSTGGNDLLAQLSPAVLVLFLCRLVQGAGGGTISVNQAYVSDVAAPEERAKALGWITAASSLGVMLGPAIGSFSVRFSSAAPGFIAAVMAGINVILIARLLPESSSPQDGQAAGRPRPPVLQALRAVITRPQETTNRLIGVYAVGMMAFMAMNGIMALFLADRFGITEENIGWFYVALGLVSVVMRAAVLGAVVRLFGEVRVLRVGALLLASGMFLAPLASSSVGFLAAVLLVPTGTALLFPSTTSLVSRHAGPGEVGQALGVQQSFGGMSRLLAPIWAGAVYQAFGAQTTFWVSAGLAILAGMVALTIKPRARRRAPGSVT